MYFKQNIGQSQEDFPLQAVQLEQLNINQVDKQSYLNKFYCFKIVKELLKTILHVELANWNV